jgi:hypothetical protein
MPCTQKSAGPAIDRRAVRAADIVAAADRWTVLLCLDNDDAVCSGIAVSCQESVRDLVPFFLALVTLFFVELRVGEPRSWAGWVARKSHNPFDSAHNFAISNL